MVMGALSVHAAVRGLRLWLAAGVRVWLLMWVAVLGAAWVSPPVAAQQGPSTAAAGDLLKPCRVRGFEHDVRCGHVRRPLDPAQPTGASLAVHFVVVKAVARNKQADPLVFFAGGPGQSAIDVAAAMAQGPLARLGNRRDMVFIDQRGTGRSAPLHCDKPDDAAPLAQQLDPAFQATRLKQCLTALSQSPLGDLRHYITSVAMADVDAVRAALGYQQVNVVGGSYGTRAALEYLRQFPARVRSAVIDGVAPADMVLPLASGQDAQAALDGVLAACEASLRCNERFPLLRTRWQRLLAQLHDQGPMRTTLTHPVSGLPEQVSIARATLLAAVRAPLYVPAYASALPQALHDATQGRFQTVFALASALSGGRNRSLRSAEGMHFAVVCNEDWVRAPRAVAADLPTSDFGTTLADVYREVCSVVPQATVPAAFYALPPSRTPVLVLSGGDDPVTPARHGQRVADALGPQAQHVVVAHAGHGVLTMPCMRHVLYRFIEAADQPQAVKPDLTCAAEVPRPLPFLAHRAGAAP
jgi:pimeloyl-ACP methyl ester carboxylesterase